MGLCRFVQLKLFKLSQDDDVCKCIRYLFIQSKKGHILVPNKTTINYYSFNIVKLLLVPVNSVMAPSSALEAPQYTKRWGAARVPSGIVHSKVTRLVPRRVDTRSQWNLDGWKHLNRVLAQRHHAPDACVRHGDWFTIQLCIYCTPLSYSNQK